MDLHAPDAHSAENASCNASKVLFPVHCMRRFTLEFNTQSAGWLGTAAMVYADGMESVVLAMRSVEQKTAVWLPYGRNK